MPGTTVTRAKSERHGSLRLGLGLQKGNHQNKTQMILAERERAQQKDGWSWRFPLLPQRRCWI
jgi:hypothetical protein